MGIEGWLLRLATGAVIGFCIGLTGVGGGVLVLPALTLLLGLPPSVAVGTASLYAFLTKCHATYAHIRLKTVDLRASLLLLSGAIPGNLVASWLINRLAAGHDGAEMECFQDRLGLFIGLVVLGSACLLLFDAVRRRGRAIPATGRSLGLRLARRPALRRTLCVGVGLAIGALIGATSVGGGVLLIPALMILFGLPSKRTVGTSILVAVVLTLVTAMIYSHGGQMDAPTALFMAAGSLLGVPLGSLLCSRLPEERLRAVVVAVVLAAAVLMLIH